MSGAGPPAWARRVLAALLPSEDRAGVLDEVDELFAIQCARRGVRGARRWYVRQVLAFAVQLVRHGRRRGGPRARSRFQAAIETRASTGGGGDMGRTVTELVEAARRLVRAPVFTGVAVLTIGIGIGAFTSVFGLVDAVLLEPVPYEDPDRLAWVWRDYPEAGFPRGWLAGPDAAALAEQTDAFEGVVTLRTATLNLVGSEEAAPQRVTAHLATEGLFDLLGVPLHLGREPTRLDTRPGAPFVAVLSHELWRARFGADPAIVGRTIRLSDQPVEVIGVAPESFRFVKHGSLTDPVAADLYMPLTVDLAQASPSSGAYASLVRIRRGVHPDQVEAALAAAAEPINAELQASGSSPIRLWTADLTSDLIEGVRPALVALIASATFLLLVLAANLATLLLGRAATRRHELGIRVALGAGHPRVLASVVAESALLAAAGGVLGLGLAAYGTGLIVRLAPPDLPRLGSVGLDGTVVLVAVGVAALMALAAGFVPAVHALRTSVAAAIRESGPRSGGGLGARTHGALVTAQVALSLMLLVGAGLTADAFAALARADPGFDPERTLTFEVPLPALVYQGAARTAFHDGLRARLESLPGVSAAGGSTALPLTTLTSQSSIVFPGAPGNVGDPEQDSPLADFFRVTPGYFQAAGLRLLAGRDFEELDADTTTFEIVIDDVLATRFFPGGSAIGRRAVFLGDTATVVGVVDQARLYSVHEDDRGQAYIPYALFPSSQLVHAVRTEGDPSALVPAVRATVAELDPAVPIASVRTLDEIVDASLGRQRLSLVLLAAFAVGALVLALLGIYGVVANAVIRRRQEIGVRMALGASGRSVVGLVVGQGLRLSVLGALLGAAGAAGSSRTLVGVVAGLDPARPLLYAGIALGLVGVAALASYVPARRATRIDPLEALRPE